MAGELAVLWTGGWDSTFVVLEALLVRRRCVAPHYVLDASRPSAEHELETMDRLRDCVRDRDSAAAARLNPLVVVDRERVHVDPRDAERHARLNRRMHVAIQYLWLSGYARSTGAPMALGLVGRTGGLRDLLSGDLEIGDDGARLVPRPSDDALELFRPFMFPVIAMSKVAIGDQARLGGFADLLGRTWFCHRPCADGSACGKCLPCAQALAQGMAWRLARRARWRAAVLRAVPSSRARRFVRRQLIRWLP